MPIFVYHGHDVLTNPAADATTIPCENLELARELAGELCNGVAACSFSEEDKMFRVKRRGFGNLSSCPGVTAFIFEAGATLRSAESLPDMRALKAGVSGPHKAQIFNKGLLDPDVFQAHALETVQKWGLQVSREHSQEYAERQADCICHHRGHQYSPPGPGWVCIAPAHHPGLTPKPPHKGMFIPQLNPDRYKKVSPENWECHIDRVIKVGVQNERADFDDPVAYHGLSTASGSPIVTGKWKGGLNPPKLQPTGGAYGKGVYTTPSFRMAASYAFRDWDGEARYASGGPEQSNYLAVFMLAVPPKAVGTKGKGTAFSHNVDGWDWREIEWVVPKAEKAQVYGVLMCYFHIRPRACISPLDIGITTSYSSSRLPPGKRWCKYGLKCWLIHDDEHLKKFVHPDQDREMECHTVPAPRPHGTDAAQEHCIKINGTQSDFTSAKLDVADLDASLESTGAPLDDADIGLSSKSDGDQSPPTKKKCSCVVQ